MYLGGFRELFFISILLNTVCAAGVCNVSASHIQINTILQMKINPAELGRLNATPDLGEAPAPLDPNTCHSVQSRGWDSY